MDNLLRRQQNWIYNIISAINKSSFLQITVLQGINKNKKILGDLRNKTVQEKLILSVYQLI